MASNQSSAQDPGADKNAYYIFWLLLLITIVAAIIWYYFHEQFKWFFISLRTLEFQVIVFFLDQLPSHFLGLGESLTTALGQAKAGLEISRQLTPQALSLELAEALSDSAGSYLRYPLALYLLFLCIFVFKSNVHLRLKKKFDMRSLAKQEKVNWPQIEIVTEQDLLAADLDSGPWAMAMTPLQFAKKNKLVQVSHIEENDKRFAKIKTAEYVLILNKIRAARAFSLQLGRSFQSVMAMPVHRRAIFAVFASRGCRDTEQANRLSSQLAHSAAKGSLDCTGVDALCLRYLQNTRVQEILKKHAYEFTVFISMLLLAREDGVLASADFLWVKPVDRRLWYVINNVGRQTPGVEVGGIFNHWYYEAALKRSLCTPRVDEAVKALEVALSEVFYVPTEEEVAAILKEKTLTPPPEPSSETSEAL